MSRLGVHRAPHRHGQCAPLLRRWHNGIGGRRSAAWCTRRRDSFSRRTIETRSPAETSAAPPMSPLSQMWSFLRLQEEWCALGQHPGPTSRGESGGRSQTFQAAACTAAPNLPPFHAPGDMTTARRESSSRPPRGARLLEEPKDLVFTAPEVGAKRAAVSGGECLDRGHNRG